jgi:iron complex outermembrane receptor protein
MSVRFRCGLASKMSAALFASVLVIAQAQAAITRFDIPAQPLADSLRAVGGQTSVNVLFDPPLVAGRQAPALKLESSADGAFTTLLAGTGITHEFLNERTVVIAMGTRSSKPDVTPQTNLPVGSQEIPEVLGVVRVPDGNVEHTGDNQTSLWKRFRVAQAETQSASSSTRSAGAGQDAGSDRVTLQEVVVTAQKREERLQDVPISITALVGEQLDRSSSPSVLDTLKTVPGVVTTYSRTGMGGYINIRGVGGDGLFGGTAVNAFYLDSVPFGTVRGARVPDAGIYDLERIEVLRGPQGTLFGANALNGVVRVLTKDPDLDRFDVKARALLSSTQDGGENYRADAAVNLPIMEGRLGARLTAGREELSGWIDRPNQRDANDSDVANVRLKLRAKPIDSLTLDLGAWFSRGDYGAPNIGTAQRTHTSIYSEPNVVDLDVYSLKVAYEQPSFSIVSSTSYMNAPAFGVLDFTPFCCTNTLLISDIESKVLVEELLFSSTGDGPTRWSLGGFYRDAEDTTEQTNRDGATGVVTLTPFFYDTSESFAVFGEVTRLLAGGRFELTGGLRYFEDRVITKNTPGAPPRDRRTFDAFSPRVVFSWHVAPDVMLYASGSKGFRSGVLQTPTVAATGAPGADPDTLINYEVGGKAEFADGRVALDSAVYYMEWKKVQQTYRVRVNNLIYNGVTNAPSASGLGTDLSLSFRPARGVSFGFNLNLNDLTFDEDVFTNDGLFAEKGDRLIASPKATYGAFANVDFRFGSSGYSGRVAASAHKVPALAEYNTSTAGVRNVFSGDAQAIARANFTVTSPGDWEAMLFVENLTDEDGRIRQDTFLTPSWDPRPRPRTVGVQLEYRFGR